MLNVKIYDRFWIYKSNISNFQIKIFKTKTFKTYVLKKIIIAEKFEVNNELGISYLNHK